MLVTVDPMADPRRVLRVFDLASRQPIREVPYEGARPTLAFGAGRTFAWSGERGDVGFVPGLGAPVTLAEGHDPSGTWAPGIAFSPDGRRFAYATEGTVHVVPVDGGSERALAARGVRLALDLAFSPDGRWLAAASIDDVLVWRVD
jgi:WD40 repeat protein